MEKSPDAFRTISEVAEWLDVPTHVLRFWESRFAQVKPVKRAGGRRYYRPSDMMLIGGIKRLLHDDGMTIRGVQKLLREEGVKHVAAFSQPLEHELEAVMELQADSGEPEPDQTPVPAEAADTPVSADGDAPRDQETTDQPVLAFGSVRAAEPELPIESESVGAGMLDEAAPLGDAAEDEAREVVLKEVADVAPAEPDAPLRSIPATPDVPDTDAADDAPAHATQAGYAARLITRDRRGPDPDASILQHVVETLRQVRGRDTL